MPFNLLLVLQALIVLFLALHDWVPLPPLNDMRAVQAADSRARLLLVTAISTLPCAFGLGASLYYFSAPRPAWLGTWLWISYAGLLAGAIRAWWMPYLFGGNPARAQRFRAMFAHTHAWLPERHGIRPNTLHVTFHLLLVAVLVLLAMGTLR